MKRWMGLLGSWALLVLAVSIATVSLAATTINLREQQKLNRFAEIDEHIREINEEKINALQQSKQGRAQLVRSLETEVASVEKSIGDLRDTAQTITVSTEENRVYVRRNGETVFTAVCSTGKGTVRVDGRTMAFNTPIGKFRILSKEKDPVWVPPDWHYLEEASKRGTRVVRLGYGDSIDADTGGPVRSGSGGWFSSSSGTQRIMRVQNNTVVIVEGGRARELPHGRVFTAGRAVVIPPVGTPQRRFPGVLGSYRLNLGDGYALHGTQALSQLGESVTHGCVRLGDADIEYLYEIANVGDQVVIY